MTFAFKSLTKSLIFKYNIIKVMFMKVAIVKKKQTNFNTNLIVKVIKLSGFLILIFLLKINILIFYFKFKNTRG